MSDLYLTLRHRLDSVAEWVTLGAEQMTSAQKAKGLSDERAARLVPVSGRTWVRWRQQGRVPIHSLDKVAEILGLEIQRPGLRVVEIEASANGGSPLGADDDALNRHLELLGRLDAIEAQLRQIAVKVGADV